MFIITQKIKIKITNIRINLRIIKFDIEIGGLDDSALRKKKERKGERVLALRCDDRI